MSAPNVERRVSTEGSGHDLAQQGPLNLFFVEGGTAATTGFSFVVSSSAPTEYIYMKGCLSLIAGGAADTQLYMNEGDGYGSAPSWVAIATP